jgi:predicted metal-dependent hydrolase
MKQRLTIGELKFELRRSSRRKTLGLTVDRGGELVVHSPNALTRQEISAWVQTKLLWVHKKLILKQKLTGSARQPKFVAGESFHYLGRIYRLEVVSDQDTPLKFDAKRFLLRRNAKRAALAHFREWYTANGTTWIERRVKELAKRVGVEAPRIDVRNLGYRWGSCGKRGILYFNWITLQLPVHLADYVIIHELVHLNEPHHDKSFWTSLERALPDWRERKAELAEKARELYWCSGNTATKL